MSKNSFAYLELPSTDPTILKKFYGTLFGWTFDDFGHDYAAVHGAGLEAGFNAERASKSTAPLAMIETDEIEAMESRVKDAGGTITVPTFAHVSSNLGVHSSFQK